MVTVIIPALNEEKTIAAVVALAKNSPQVSEVIVIDDKSMDNTILEARKAGAIVVTSTTIGKGASMKDGILVAKNEVVAFLDGDIETYPKNIIALLTDPIFEKRADFVKSTFSRQAGRVTQLVAKPLLAIFYPDFPPFWQPLSGMVAGKKSMFDKIDFEEGYGVDIGLLIDMYQMGANIEEVSIGHIENKMQTLEALGKMSKEVATTIIKKSNNIPNRNLQTFEKIQVIREQMEFAIRESLVSLKKIAVFDMDNTILRASFIYTAARKFGFEKELIAIASINNNPYIRTKLIGKLLTGKTFGEILAVVDSIDVTPYMTEIVTELKKQGYITGIISDSYDCVTNHLKNKFGFDFTISNELEFSRSIATGEVKVPSLFLAGDKTECSHEYCKLNALMKICGRYNVNLKNVLFVGDGENDICCLEKSGIGVSFCSSTPMVDIAADIVIKEPDFKHLSAIIE